MQCVHVCVSVCTYLLQLQHFQRQLFVRLGNGQARYIQYVYVYRPNVCNVCMNARACVHTCCNDSIFKGNFLSDSEMDSSLSQSPSSNKSNCSPWALIRASATREFLLRALFGAKEFFCGDLARGCWSKACLSVPCCSAGVLLLRFTGDFLRAR
jgi:hypothetical protein